MSLVKRLVKGAPLTLQEGDDNLDYLEGLATAAAAQDLASVLSVDNITGGNNIVLSDNDTIDAANGSASLNLRDGVDGSVKLAGDTITLDGAVNLDIIGSTTPTTILATDADGNVVDGSTLLTSSQTLAQTLATGNTTSGNDIVLSNNDTIDAASGGGQLDLRAFNTDNYILLSNEAGTFNKCALYMEDTLLQLYNNSTGGNIEILAFGDSILQSSNTVEISRWIGAFDPPVDKIEVKENQIVVTSAEVRLVGNTFRSNASTVRLTNLPTYADDVAAKDGGLTENTVYKTATGELRIVV